VWLPVATCFHTSPFALLTAAPPIEVQPGSSAAALVFALVCTSNVTTAGAADRVYVMVTRRLVSCVIVESETSGTAAVSVAVVVAASAATVIFLIFIGLALFLFVAKEIC
jgi:hypothetical protein